MHGFYRMIKTHIILWMMAFFILCGLSAHAAETEDSLTVGDMTFPVYTVQKARNDNESFVILFLGDGYTKDQQADFVSDVSARSALLLSREPFRSYSDQTNIYAVFTPSAESGATDIYGDPKDTYFHIAHSGNVSSFRLDGEAKANEIRNKLENDYLDHGATVGIIHVLSNADVPFGTSTTPLYSFSSTDEIYSGIDAALHEIAHSIGRLKDECRKIYSGVNTSSTSDPTQVPWNKMLGFRGIGVLPSVNDPSGYVPSSSCIMKESYADAFCEVCKLELAKRMHSTYYRQKSDPYYVADPDLTADIQDQSYNDRRIHNGNLIKANGHNLTLRTIVQNLVNQEQTLTLSLKIVDVNGHTKYETVESFTIPPLPDYPLDVEYEAAKVSLSVTLQNVSGLVYTDRVLGQVTDSKTNIVVATDQTDRQNMVKLRIHHKLKTKDGTVTNLPQALVTTVYAPVGSRYALKPLERIGRYLYIGHNAKNDTIEITADGADIDFYYKKPEPSIDMTVSDDGKTFHITAHELFKGRTVLLALYDKNASLCDFQHFLYQGEDLRYTAKTDYTESKLMVWKDLKTLTPVPLYQP